MASDTEWETEAGNWLQWARTPGHDAYWYYRDAFFAVIVPPPGRRTIEIGCGEGRVARDLNERGHRVAGVDTSPTLLAHAKAADPGGSYLLADGAVLPFPATGFDVAVAYNSIMDVADMAGTVGEAARVLTPGGRLCICVPHPLSDAGRFVGDGPDAPFTITGSYFGRRRVEDSVERDGLRITFRGWSYSLEDYARAIVGAGLVIDAIREPRPAGPVPPHYERFGRLPMFLHLRAVKP